MSEKEVRGFIANCQGLSDEEIIKTWHSDYFDETKPHVRKAFDRLGIDEWEVSEWVRRNIK